MESVGEISSMQTAWESSRVFQQVEDKHKADSKVLGLPPIMKQNEYANLKIRFVEF